jgi:hypothetical protein
MPVGVGPVGGVFGADTTPPQVFARVPAPSMANISPRTPIEFDVVDYGGNYASFILTVSGVLAYAGGVFVNGWSGSVTAIASGVRVNATPPSLFTALGVVQVSVTATDASGNTTTATWDFTIASSPVAATVEVIGNRCLLLTVSPGFLVDSAIFDPSNYAVETRLGYAAPMFTRTATPGSSVRGQTTTTVTVCMRDLFSQGGRYLLRVSGLTSEFGDTVLFSVPFDT